MRRVIISMTILLSFLVAAPAAHAAFGISNFQLDFENADKTADTQAGSHPFAVTNKLSFTTHIDPELGEAPDGAVRNLTVRLPEGLVGDPQAVPRCSNADFINFPPTTKIPSCSDSSAVGTVLVKILFRANESTFTSAPVFNLVPSPGSVQKLGFVAAGVPVTIDFKVNPEPPYNVIATLSNIAQPLAIMSSLLTVWGNPASPVHDEERGHCVKWTPDEQEVIQTTGASCPSEVQELAYVTLPRACLGPFGAPAEAVSWQEPFAVPALGADPSPLVTSGCNELSFKPSIAGKPTESSAETSSGIDFDLNMASPGLTDPTKNAGSDIEKVVATLPEGVTTNPAVASGLGACSEGQYDAEQVQFDPNTGCPDNSKVGSVEIETPLLEETVKGSMYLAQQRHNPFNSLLALYIVIRNEKLGILVRQAGKVEPDPTTGRLTTTFEGIPQLPFSHFHLHFREGSRAPLITPATCGNYAIAADLYPYANPGVPVHSTATFSIDSGAGGAHCASSANQLPTSTSFSAGTMSPAAGTYSPFVLNLSRPDGSQQFGSITTTLPKGLLGKLAGIPYCSDSSIAQAVSRTAEGQGAVELASPSCPQSSEVGTVTVGAGAGDPFYVKGHAYLAGPYKGAPLSLEIITPAIAGPFDLGVVAVRTALNVNLSTTEITAVSDPIPMILHGLPLDVRSISINMSRPNFTLNPTSCEPKAIVGSVISTLGTVTPVNQYFQASECGRLKFKPTLHIRLKGLTRRSGHPALRAVLTYPKQGAYANVAKAQVGLPHSEFLDQGNIGTVCTQPQLRTKTCPKKSIYGRATAWSPLLEKPLSGPVYLGVGYGHKLPDLVADLDGQIRVLLNGKVDQTKQKGLRTTFEAVPDAPVSKFVLELKGGPKYGLLVNSEDICRKAQNASTKFVAQNGIVFSTQTPIQNECKGEKEGKPNSGKNGAKKQAGRAHGR